MAEYSQTSLQYLQALWKGTHLSATMTGSSTGSNITLGSEKKRLRLAIRVSPEASIVLALATKEAALAFSKWAKTEAAQVGPITPSASRL
jgi:hypothetical protein